VGASFELQLSSPEVVLSIDKQDIRRMGTTPDTPLDALQPAVQPLTIAVNWPDGLSRPVRVVTLTVNGQPTRFTSEQWTEDDQGRILLNWDISEVEEGTFELVAQITDELGYSDSSEPLTVNIASERPEVPTPVPTVETQEEVAPSLAVDWREWAPFAALLVLFLLLIFIWSWRRRRKYARKKMAADEAEETGELEDAAAGDIIFVASLEPIANGDHGPFTIEGTNIAIGRDAQNVQIFLTDDSVNRLHARIRKQGQEYWLFDEGSFEGTYLNYERLGLAPQKLSDGDAVQFGKVSFRFRLRQIIQLE
jgi:hypothetical protein